MVENKVTLECRHRQGLSQWGSIAQEIIATVDKLGLAKLKSFCITKETVKWGNLCCLYNGRGLIYRINKEHLKKQLNKKSTTQYRSVLMERLNISKRMKYKWLTNMKIMFNLTNHQKNANQDYSLSYLSHNDSH